MKKAGIDKARKRLALARQHLEAVRVAKTFEEFEPAWYQFLVATNSVDGILEGAAKGPGTSQPWYGGKIHQRRNDPLLSYMHAARNVDEHGIEPVAVHVKAVLFIGTDARGWPFFGASDRPFVHLVPVKDERFGDVFKPPTEHLGKPLANNAPYPVAALWLAYWEALTDEAESRVTG